MDRRFRSAAVPILIVVAVSLLAAQPAWASVYAQNSSPIVGPNGLNLILYTVYEGTPPNPIDVIPVEWQNYVASVGIFTYVSVTTFTLGAIPPPPAPQTPMLWNGAVVDTSDYITGFQYVTNNQGDCANQLTLAAAVPPGIGGTCDEELLLSFPNEIDYGDIGLSLVTTTVSLSNQPVNMVYSFYVQIDDVPEPSSPALFATAALVLAMWHRQRMADGIRQAARAQRGRRA
jgi:hypothetical protein